MNVTWARHRVPPVANERLAMAYEASLGVVALTRFGYGPRGDGDTAIAAADPRGFLQAELTQPGITLLSGAELPITKVAIQQFFGDRARRKAEKDKVAAAEKVAANLAFTPAMTGQGMNAPSMNGPATMQPPDASSGAMPGSQVNKEPAPVKEVKAQNAEQTIFRGEALARIHRAIEARAGFAERLVAFWSNHFCVSVAKGGFARISAGSFEREAIRPHVLGRFADMLAAAESHPAMLHYLDNAGSVGPNSVAGQRSHRGLNENIGREILELHTLGVGSGYTQTDVTNLARILTGWTVVGPPGMLGEPGTFAFNANAHDPGPIELLGRTYAQDGPAQGLSALSDLARHPATAKHIAGKLARAFVADVPPPALVARLAKTFRDSDGDLRLLATTLVESPESWDPSPRRMRDPYEFVIGTHRLLQRLPDDPGVVLGPLRELGMALWQPPGPNGFPTEAAAWAAPENMKLRLDYAALVAQRLKDPPNPSDLVEALCGGTPSPETRDAIARAESRQQGLALLLMSPEMQRS